jgi:hypothetical protein
VGSPVRIIAEISYPQAAGGARYASWVHGKAAFSERVKILTVPRAARHPA